MGKTHTGVLRRFGYYPSKIRRSAGLFRETEGIRYFQHERGYVVALRSNGAWRHCHENGTRIGKGQNVSMIPAYISLSTFHPHLDTSHAANMDKKHRRMAEESAALSPT